MKNNNNLTRTFLNHYMLPILYVLLLVSIISCNNSDFGEEVIEESVLLPSDKISSSSVSLSVVDVSADVVQNPNIPDNILDTNDNSRWSGFGDPVNLFLDMGSSPLVDYLKISFFRGNIRTTSFDVYVRDSENDNWERINSKTSSGTTTSLEIFDLDNREVQFIRLEMYGNSINNWNSIIKLEVWGTPDEDQGPGPGNNSFDYPYAIPKFRNAIAASKFQAPNSNTAATSSALINGYSSKFFYVADTDRMAFYQTGSSKRSELRFLDNWRIGNGNRSAHANLKFISQRGEQTTFMQIHDDANVGNGPNKPLLRMYRTLDGNRIKAAIKTDDGGSNTTHIDCGAAPSGYFDCDVELRNGRMIISINGSEKVNRNVSYWDFPSYWKAGVYNQNSGGTTIYFDELTWN